MTKEEKFNHLDGVKIRTRGSVRRATRAAQPRRSAKDNKMKTISTWILWGLSIASALALSLIAFVERYGVEKYNVHRFGADFPTHNIFFHYTIPLLSITHLLIIAFMLPRFKGHRKDLIAINAVIMFLGLLSVIFSYFITMTQIMPVAP